MIGYRRKAVHQITARLRIVSGIRRNLPILVVGHPRNGTGHASQLLRAWGLDVGHEEIGRDGISAWYAMLNSTPPACNKVLWEAYQFTIVIHVLRDPAQAAFSVAFADPTSDLYRHQHLGLQVTNDRFRDALASLEHWYHDIRSRFPNSFTFRIEYDSQRLFSFLGEHRLVSGQLQRTKYNRYNSRYHNYEHINRSQLLVDYAQEIAHLRTLYGYEQ